MCDKTPLASYRIVASGSEMKSCLIPETAHVNNFQRAFNLQYKDVSDAQGPAGC